MTPLETILESRIAELLAEIKFLQTNPRPIEKLFESENEYLETKVAELEAKLADRPMVFAIQNIYTKEIHRGCFVGLYESVEAAEYAIRTEFEPSEHQAVVYNGRPIG